MTSRDRILAVLAGAAPDRTPVLGGFLVAENHYLALSGLTPAQFAADPAAGAIAAYHALGADALLMLRLPTGLPGLMGYRPMTREQFQAHHARFPSLDSILAWIASLPSPAQALARFDPVAWADNFLAHHADMQSRLGSMIYLPTQWDVVHPTFEHYNFLGYEKYMELLALYPEAADALFAHNVEVHRAIAALLVDLYRRLDLPPLVHVGTDICGRDGPVASPALLRQIYFPHVRRSLEPLVEAGFTTVWHADGRIGPLVGDLLSCGLSGFQGFQWEYGLDLADFCGLRTLTGQPLAIFAGPSTSSTLPFGTLSDVRRERDTILSFASRLRLFYLPSNDILPDTPIENLLESHRISS